MPIFKCKMCGGSLEVSEGMTVCECEYCGTKQTLPKTDNEQALNMFNRANHFRQQCEFDKAAEIYERMTAQRDDAELYWSIVLCRYGIEYVGDPLTKKKIPTCHRTQFKSILEDADYLEALQRADSVQHDVYKAEAEYIDKVQKGILEISNKEKPFDVFICYKETDENGRRTQDSVLAQELYYGLQREGFKVFFSRITLESKLGTEYEPYIFAALNSAKVMVVVGTKPEYFNAVWVRNEWSRYLMLMQENRSLTLIPAYKDMDPYDLPDALSMFQAQDMSKLGFMQDLIHGIRKIVTTEQEKPAAVVRETVVQKPAGSNIENLLKRGALALEDGDWSAAENFYEQVLNEDVEEYRAYVGKLLAELHVLSEKALEASVYPDGFSGNSNFAKAVRFADEKNAARLKELDTQTKYNYIVSEQQKANTPESLRSVGNLFAKLGDFKNSAELSKQCWEQATELEYQAAVSQMEKAYGEAEFKLVAGKFRELDGYKDSAELAERCLKEAEESKKNRIYGEAKSLMKMRDRSSLESAINKFKSIEDWKDSAECIKDCKAQIEKIDAARKRAKEEMLAREEAERQLAKKKKKILTVSAATAAAILTVGTLLAVFVIIPSNKYKKAIDLADKGSYDEAIVIFKELGNYKDSEKQFKYIQGIVFMDDKHYIEAKNTFSECGDFNDSEEKTADCQEYIDTIITKCNTVPNGTISGRSGQTFGLKSDGTVVAVGNNSDGQCDVSDWKDIIAVSAGEAHVVGLKSDGTVVAVGKNSDGQCNVSDWKDIIAVSAGLDHTVGLKSDGTVVAVGKNFDGRFNVSGWKDIIAVSSGGYHTVGLKSDGTVVANGYNHQGQCDVSDWKDIISVSAGEGHTVGLKSDGTVVAVGKNSDGQCNVSDWKDIIAVSAGLYHTVGLKSDGTVVAVGKNYDGQCNVSNWKDIIAVSSGDYHTVGLKSDGTVVAVGYNSDNSGVSDWKDIKTTNE